MTSKVKTRNIPHHDYLIALQKEYFVNEIKSKIYTKSKDKAFYRRVMSNKREKIEDISFKHRFKNIFNDKDTHNEFRQIMYPEFGIPAFECSKLDIKYYFSKDTQVRVNTETGTKIGTIMSVSEDYKIIHVKLKGDPQIRPFLNHEVGRIL